MIAIYPSQQAAAADIRAGVRNAQEVDILVVRGLGTIGLNDSKHCSNYRITMSGRMLLATLVHVPELEQAYVEVESIVDTEAEVGPALDTIRNVLGELGIRCADETTETYTDAVAARLLGLSSVL